MGDVILPIATGGLSVVIRAGVEAVVGRLHERGLELQRCSEALKEGWASLSQSRGKMRGKHNEQAFDAVSRAPDSPGGAWGMWRRGRQQTIEHYRSEKRAAWQGRQGKHGA